MKTLLLCLAVATCFLTETPQTRAQSTGAFTHPGGWHTVADIAFVRRQLGAKAEPWTSARSKLLGSGPQTDFQPHPVAVVTRGGGGVDQGGNAALRSDASDAYTLMIKWIATGDSRYGDAAIRDLDGWSAVLREIRGSDARLAAGIYGSKFAEAAELAAYYKPAWPNKSRAQKMFRDVFYPVIAHGASSNWGTSCMAGMIAMGVFCDDHHLFNEAVSAYRIGWPQSHPDGYAAVTQYIDATGECAESGRDQPHTQGGIGHLVETAAVAWNQGIDLFHEGNDRLRDGLEYTAKYNLGYEVPWHQFADPQHLNDHWPGLSAKGRGRWSPIYEMAALYFDKAHLSAPYTHQVVESPGYAPEFTNGDHPGLGTLMFRSAAQPAGNPEKIQPVQKRKSVSCFAPTLPGSSYYSARLLLSVDDTQCRHSTRDVRQIRKAIVLFARACIRPEESPLFVPAASTRSMGIDRVNRPMLGGTGNPYFLQDVAGIKATGLHQTPRGLACARDTEVEGGA